MRIRAQNVSGQEREQMVEALARGESIDSKLWDRLSEGQRELILRQARKRKKQQ